MKFQAAGTQKMAEKENDSSKKPVKKPTNVGKETQASGSGAQSAPKGDSNRDAALALKTYNTEVLGVLKELNANQNKINEKIEKLSSRVDSFYDNQDYDYNDECYYDSSAYGVANSPTDTLDESYEMFLSEPPSKKQKTDDSIFKNISEKFNPKETVDIEINEDLAEFVNATFRDGISDERQTELVKDIHRPSNCQALVKTKVNQSIWRLLKPHTQTDDVKMQTIQNNIVKAAINVTKIMNELGQQVDPRLIELGTNAIGLLGQSNKLLNNKRKEFHKQDLDTKYHYLTSANFPFTDSLYGDDVNKNVKEIQDMNKLGRNIGRGMTHHGYGYNRGRRGYPRHPGRGRGYRLRTFEKSVEQTSTSTSASASKNFKAGPRK